MNKKYIDFVPTKDSKTKSVSQRRAIKQPNGVPVVMRTEWSEENVSAEGFSIASGVTLGVVEDVNPKFVRTDVPKRPLSKANATAAVHKSELERAKAKKVGGVRLGKLKKIAEKEPVKEVKKSEEGESKNTFKTPFINQAKVAKRPLSKNVYQKKVVVPKEEPKGPITIITKAEKDAHVSLIVTIILTIILGAAAGTVAFLLLPK